MPTVTVVTAGAASADGLSEADYREIYAELRGKTTLRQFAEFVGSAYSFAWWSKFERGLAPLTRPARQELRRAVGLPELPLAVGEALAGADPDATVWRVRGPSAAAGASVNRVVLVGREVREPVTLRINGDLQIVGETPVPKGVVTGVTGAGRRAVRGAIHLSRGRWERLNAARLARGVSWEEFLAPLEERFQALDQQLRVD